MDLRIQPKPDVFFLPASRGIVSRKQFFVKKNFEEINQYFFPALFIRHWKPKADLLYTPVSDVTAIQYECDFNRDVQSCFVEDYAEEIFLRTPPPCFVVFGKSGNSVIELGKQIAKEYGSVLMNVDDIVERVLQTETQTAKILDRILRLGVSLTLNFVLALLSYVAHTPEARHRGYVLCGLPSPAFSQDMPADQQFHYLFAWDNKPTFFVNVLFEDEDLIKERTSWRYELRNLGNDISISRHFVHDDVREDKVENEGAHAEDISVQDQETSYEPDIDISPSRPWVQLPRDEESRVWTELELYDIVIRPAIELINCRVDPQYFVTVDSRLNNEYEIVKARLHLLQVWKVPEAVPFTSLKQEKTEAESEAEGNETAEDAGESSEKGSSYDEDILRVAEELPQISFLTLFTKKTISPKFRWELSHYNYICPVSLREGEVVDGKSKFAVCFMKYIYFLRDRECVIKFMKNPRAYVLPIRPRPLCRFFILGYPYSGKTTLARTLAWEFSIPLINVEEVMKRDAERKKNSYQEFCRQSAECRELIRLTALAWQDWRKEEEERVNLIEQWILYLQALLRQRIDQFYSPEVLARETSKSETVSDSSQNFQSRSARSSTATSRATADERRSTRRKSSHTRFTPSAELLEALKERRSDYDKNEANSYFSYLWRTFSGRPKKRYMKSTSSTDYYGEGEFEEDEGSEDENDEVNWCDLLPPQSLSSLLINKLPYTTRVKRESFKVFLEAASKAYHQPSKLKSEFKKWHLPCYMDIPLCGIFLENPMILLKYLPVWLRERPLIPEPVDSTHPSVAAAGENAFHRAGVVVVRQSPEEQGILLRNAIEKAERDGMRVTGEVITPGGWVVDNMTLDLAVWKKLICEHVFADHVYILKDSELGHKRIINTWWDLYGKYFYSKSSLLESEFEEDNETPEETETPSFRDDSDESSQSVLTKTSIASLLAEWVAISEKGEKHLDEVFEMLNTEIIKYFIPPIPVDSFCHFLFENTLENWNDLREEAGNEESLYLIQMITGLVSKTFLWNREVAASVTRIPLGTHLEICDQDVLDYFKGKASANEKSVDVTQDLEGCLEFFKNLITLPKKLEQLKELFKQTDRSDTIEEVDISGRNPEAVFKVIYQKLMSPFIKRPRELEDFEIEEIRASTKKEPDFTKEEEDEDEENEPEAERKEGEEEEDIRIFGESGQLCIVHLERNKYLRGKLNFALRYWGKLYYFWNQAAKEKFIENPEKYAPYYSAIRCYPPLRIYMVGPTGSGRTTCSLPISRQFNLSNIDYFKFLKKRLIPYSNPVGEKYTVIDKYSLLLSENLNEPAKNLKEKFMKIPYARRQFWMEQSFHTSPEDNKEIYDLLNKLSSDDSPQVNFPDLKYNCVESVYDTYGDDYMELEPKVVHFSETPFTSMKELELIIQKYLETDTDLSDFCREKSLKVLWEQEPFVRIGFILEGYPMRGVDLNHVINNTWVPDLVLEIILPENLVIERNVDLLMSMWEAKLKKETAEHESLELALTTIQSNCRAIKEKELILEKQKLFLRPTALQSENFDTASVYSRDHGGRNKQRKRRLTQEFYWNTEEDVHVKLPAEVKEDIEKILDEEYPTLVFKPTFETYSSGKERISDHLQKTCKRDTLEIENIRSIVADLDIPWIKVDGTRPKEEIINNLLIKLDKIRDRSCCKGEFAFTMKMEMAEKLLEQGYYFLSKFGRLCPVQVYRMKNPVHMFRPLNAKGKVTPIAYRSYIYFVGGESEKLKFLEDPLRYVLNEPHHPVIPLRVAVIGPPKSGKTALSKRLGAMFDMKVVTMGSALRFALEKIPHSTLAKSIDGYLRRGCFLPLSLKLEALMVCLNDPSCVTQGFVFDGIPFDAALTQSLAERGKLPYVIISLVADSHFGKVNREDLNLNEFRLPYKQRINMDSRYKDWVDTYKRFSNWNRNTYNNLHEIDAKLSTVDIFYHAFDIIKKSFFDILYYFEHCVGDKALPLRNLCVGPQEFQLKKSAFGSNCPVCWAEVRKLKICLDSSLTTGLFQYLNHMYWICPYHEEKFLRSPKLYLPPSVPCWPEMLPERFRKTLEDRTSVQLKVHGYGRCPVTRTDFPSSLEWEGSWEFAASYAGEIFLCKNEKMLERFLAQPWRYYRADTKFEVNRPEKSNAVIKLGPPKLTSLPPIGFLEQTVAALLHEALQMAGSLRPVYPNIHPRVTACILIALYLKVYNSNKKCSFLDVQSLDYFMRSCKATKFKVQDLRPPEDGFNQGEYEPDYSEDSDSVSGGSRKSEAFERNWLDFETQASKRMWSAKHLSQRKTEMKLTEDDELVEIPEIPATVAVLKYQNYSLRPSPLPPIEDCLNFIYSIPPRVQVPEKFNYNSLTQPSVAISSPFTPRIMFNPLKQFSQSLFHRKEPSFPSSINLHDDKRVMSDVSMPEIKPRLQGEPNAELMKKGFFPRFQMLDKFTPGSLPSVPQVVEKEPLILNPHHEYSHMLLFSELFKTTHHIKSFQLSERHRHLEYLHRMDKKLDPNTTQVDYIFPPKITPSMRSRTSVESYQLVFDVVTPFLVTDTFYRVPLTLLLEDQNEEDAEEDQAEGAHEGEKKEPKMIINPSFAVYLEKLLEDGGEAQRTSSHVTCDSFEVNVVPKNSDTSQTSEVLIHEILPYPPLNWDILCRPYYAYCSIPAIFEQPHLEDIAHERHVSLLDGITELHDDYRFVPYPTNVQVRFNVEARTRSKKRKNVLSPTCHFYFDFFNIPWTAFLTYPYKCASITASGSAEGLSDKEENAEGIWNISHHN